MEIHVYLDDEKSKPRIEIMNFWRDNLDKKDPQVITDLSSRIMCETMKELVKHIVPGAVTSCGYRKEEMGPL